LHGDSGAKAVLQAHPDKVHRLQVDDPGIVQDVDTPEDLQKLSGRWRAAVARSSPLPFPLPLPSFEVYDLSAQSQAD